MAKKVDSSFKLQIPAGQANPSPPVGPALGQRGVNIMEFCKAFNAATQSMEAGLPIPVVITVYSDRSFTYIMKTPPASVLLRKIVGIAKGSGRPIVHGRETREKRAERSAKLAELRELEELGFKVGLFAEGTPGTRGRKPNAGS